MESSWNTQSKHLSRKNSNNGDLGFELRENSVIASKSAHSSRSFNGYQQINQYELRERLGKGSFAEVYLAYDTSSEGKEKYAVKVMESKQIKKKFLLRKSSQMLDKEGEGEGKDEEEEVYSIAKPKESLASMFVRNEVAILKKMNHQYITKLYDVIVDNDNSKVYLVLEHCGGGFINESKTERGMYRKLLESECKRYYKQIVLAVDYSISRLN
jgi:calcium/calmodulin-dependent protein kinase kinase 2